MALAAALASWDTPTTSAEGLRRYQQLAVALETAKGFIYPRDVGAGRSSSKPVETPQVTNAFTRVIQNGRGDDVYQDFTDAVQDRFELVQLDMLTYMSRINEAAAAATDTDLANKLMAEMLERLALWQRAWGVPLKAFNDPKRISSFTALFHQLLHSSLPPTFPEHLRTFLLASLARLPDPDSGLPMPKATAPSPHLSRLGILPRYSATLSRVAYEEIERIAREEADKGWDERRLAKARHRVGQGVAGWLGGMFEGNEAAQSALRPMFSRFDYYLCKVFFDIRTDELFDIIVDYPDSLAALEDLKECLFKVDLRSDLVDKLNKSNKKRLLHPGAETKDVITQYISTIRCLRFLDPPGVLLHKVAEPIRRHLRSRSDTIRCIVSFLVEGEELQDENELGAGNGVIGQSGEDEAESFLDPKWDPEPVDAAPEFRSGKASDIISTLVSIYETREVIIKELQVLLATRLLAVKDYDAVKEIRTIELLKIRFGEAALGVCDVMLKDMADSKRIDGHVHGDIQSSVHPLIISRMFWPNVQSSSLHLPPKLEQAATAYADAFHHFKPDKHLRWLQHLGTVDLTITHAEGTLEITATTLQASIVELFEEGGKSQWTVDGLVEKLGVGEDVVRAGLAFWAGHRILLEVGGGGGEGEERWGLVEEWGGKGVEAGETSMEQASVVETAAGAGTIPDIDLDRVNHLASLWKDITAPLSALGPQSLEDLHRMASRIQGYNASIDELDLLLAQAKTAGAVDHGSDGKWSLRR